jgi:hypothetical protein
MLSLSQWGAPAGAAPGPREWTVSGPELRSNETIYLEENVTIEAGGRLVLDNASLLFNSSAPGALSLEVRAGGELVLMSSMLDQNGSEPYLVLALPGSKVTISSCTISHAGTCSTEPALSGVCIRTDLARIDNTTFRNNAAGICIKDASPTISYCLFQDDAVGALLDGSGATFDHCRFPVGGGNGAVLENGSRVLALDTDIDPSSVVVSDGASQLDVEWTVAVGVFWDDGRPAAGALVRVRPADAQDSLYQANSTGWAGGIGVTAFTVDSSKATDHGPFNISAELSGRMAWNITGIGSETELWLYLDATPPEVEIAYPSDGAILNISALEAHGRAWDPNSPHDTPDIGRVEAGVDAAPLAPASGTAEWSFNLSNLTEGNHTLTVRAWDLAGNSNESSARFEVDLSAPSLDVWPPFGYVTAGRSITVRILSDAASLFFDGRRLAGNIPGQPFETGWSLDSEGNNTAEVRALDAAGNSAAVGLLVVRDTVGPSITITSPPAFATLGTSVAVVTGRCADEHGVAAVEVSLDQANWTRCAGNSSWTATVVLAEGVEIIHIRATDALGNTNTSWLQLTVRLPDTAPPELLIQYPEDGQELADRLVEVTGRAADPGGVALVQVSLDNSTWVNATGTVSWQAELSLAPGNNTIFVRAFDRLGNANRTGLRVSYSPPPPDATPPSLDILYPPAGLKFTQSKAVVSGKATDPAGVVLVEVSVNGGNWSRCMLTGEDFSGTVTLSPGDNTISVRAFDSAGNQANRTMHVTFSSPPDAGRERGTYIVILVCSMLALGALWLLWRNSRLQVVRGGGEGRPRPGTDGLPEEEE